MDHECDVIRNVIDVRTQSTNTLNQPKHKRVKDLKDEASDFPKQVNARHQTAVSLTMQEAIHSRRGRELLGLVRSHGCSGPDWTAGGSSSD